MPLRHRSVVLFLCLSWAGLSTGVVAWDEQPPQPAVSAAVPSAVPLSVPELVSRVRNSVVVITVPDRDGREEMLGTGFVVSADGLIATNLHVVGRGRPISVRTADKELLPVIAVHASDQMLDLAVLKVDLGQKTLLPLPLGNSQEIADGARVVVLGNPLGLKHSVVSGVVSGRREIDGREMLQLAVPIEPGNSGGPVLDMLGRVHGVVTAKSLVKQNLGFAVQSKDLKPLLDRPNSVPLERWLTIGQIDRHVWTPLFGARWHQRGGRLLVDGKGKGFGGRSLCLRNEESPGLPYEIAVFVKLDDEQGAAGLVFHADGGQKHYGFYPSAGKLRLSRFDGENVFSWNVLREISSPHYQPEGWNHLKVRVEEKRLLCYLNDHLVIESADRVFTKGRVGLAKFRDTRAEFKQFIVGDQLAPSRVAPEVADELRSLVEKLPGIESLRLADLAPLTERAAASVVVLRDKAEALERQAAELRRVAGDVHTQKVVRELVAVTRPKDGVVDLLRAGLLIAQLDEEEVDVDAYVAGVERLAEGIRQRLSPEATRADRMQALDQCMFKENGFHGARFDYYHRANSYLNRVLDDRTGLPITLSVLYIELGRRVGLEIEGVGLPGHFIVRVVGDGAEPQYVDVFNEARHVGAEGLGKLVRQYAGRALRDADLRPSTPKSIVLRMLANLRGLAERSQDNEATLRYLEAMVAIEPEALAERGARSIIRYNTGRRDAAVADLDWFLEHRPNGLDLDRIREMRDLFSRQPAQR